jgi:hypothetical protein
MRPILILLFQPKCPGQVAALRVPCRITARGGPQSLPQFFYTEFTIVGLRSNLV